MKNMLRRPIAMLLAMIMILSCVPMEGLAAIVPVNGPTTSSDGISLFSIVQPSDTYTRTYIFKNGETTVSTQIVKDGESLLDPGTPSGTGKFLGWYDGDTQVTFDTPITVTETKEITCTPRFDNILHVYFVHNNIIVATKEAQADADGYITVTTNDVTVNVGAEEKFNGWSDGTEIVGDSFTTKTQEDVTLTASVSTGHWITFDSKEGSYVEPLFVPNGKKGTEPTAPTRPGYTFSHWSKEDGTDYDWENTPVTDSLTLHAVWTAKTDTQYTVIHWLENADDNNYSYKESETKTGTTGDDTAAAAKVYSEGSGWSSTPTNKDYQGFTAQDITQQTIAGDGSTIVNVYYKRNVYSIKFYEWQSGGHHHRGFAQNVFGTWVGFGCYSGTEDGNPTCGQTETTDGYVENEDLRITAKYGANISDKWPKSPDSTTWKVTPNGSVCQSGIDTMPLKGDKFYEYTSDSQSSSYGYYYVQSLNDENKYELHHTDTVVGSDWTVTEDDRYPITGFTLNKTKSTGIGSSYNGAKFYYTRNSYNIVYVSGGATVKTQSYKYQADISKAGDYEPTTTPTGKDNYTFGGWYEDESLKVSYDFATVKTMPANSITVYAKWNPPVYTLTVQLKVEVDDNGKKEEIIADIPVGEDRADALNDLQKTIMNKLGDGYEWHGWKKKDGTPFNVHTKIIEDTTIYASFSKTGKFSVVYDVNDGTGTAPTDGNSYADGAKATVLSGTGMTAPAGKVFLGWNTKDDGTGTTYQPGSSFPISANAADAEKKIHLYAQWGGTPDTVSLTYHANYDTTVHHFKDGTPEITTSTVNDIPNNGTVYAAGTLFTVPVGYAFGGWATTSTATTVEIGANDPILIDNEGSNDLYAVWTLDTTQTHTVSYTVKYFKANDAGGYDEMIDSKETHNAVPKWIGEAVEIEVNVNTAKDLPDGYAFEKTEPATLPAKYTVAAYGQDSTNNEIRVYYKKNQFQLTIYYKYANGSTARDDYTENVTVGGTYSVDSPTITGYTPDQTTVSGTMPANNVEVTVTYTANSHAVKYEYTGDVQPTNAPTVPPEANHNYGTEVTVAPTPSLAGYTFDGWKKDGTIVTSFTMPDEDVTLKGEWHAKTDTPYTVEWYLEDLNGNYPTTATASITRTGTTNDTASVTDDDKKGIPDASIDDKCITLDENKNSEWSGTIAGDGSLVLKLYFKRNTYNVTYAYYIGNVPSGASTLPDDATYKYGAEVTVAAPAKAGDYVFSGWSTDDATIVDGKFTMPANDVEIIGSWPYYFVEWYLEDLYGNYPDTPFYTSTRRDKNVNETAAPRSGDYSMTGYTFDTDNADNVLSGTVDADGSLKLKLYFTLNSYTVTYAFTGDVRPENEQNLLPTGGTHKYKSPVTVADAPTAAGYTFSGWSTNAVIISDGKFTMPYWNVTLTGSWQIDASKTVEVKYTAEGHGKVSNDSDTIQIVTANGLTGSTATAESGYKFVGWYKGNEMVSDTAVLDPTTAKAYLNKDANGNYAATEFVAKFKRDFENGGDDDEFKFVVGGYEGTYDAEEHTVTISGLIAGEDLVSFSTDGGTTWTDPVAWDGTIPDNLKQSEVKWNTTPSAGYYYYVAGGIAEAVAYPTVCVRATNGTATLTRTGTITINPVSLNINIKGAKIKYDGKAHGLSDAAGYKLSEYYGLTGNSALVGGQTLSITEPLAKYSTGTGDATETVTNVGTYYGMLAGIISITDGSNSTLLNYLISVSAGPLEIYGDGIVPEKTLVTEGTVELGSLLTYNITVKNVSTTAVTNVQVEDPTAEIIVPQGVTGVTLSTDKHTATIDSIPAGGEVVLNAQHTVTEQDLIEYAGKDADGKDKLYKNTANITLDDVTINVSDGGIDLPEPESKLTVTKKSTNKGTGENGAFKLGETIEYTITVKNTGNQTITDIVVTDGLADATIIAGTGYTVEENKAVVDTLAPNDSVTVKAEYTVTEADILAGSVINSATAKGNSKDPDKPEPDGTDETEDDTEEPNAHFSLEKKLTNLPNKGYFTVGETAEFDVVVTNDGNVTLNNVNVFETLTGAEFTAVAENESNAEVTLNKTVAAITSLAPGRSVTLKAEYTVKAEDLGNKDLKNVVTGKGEGPKTDPEKPIDPPEDQKTDENIPVDDAVIVKITKKWDDEENKYESRPESVSFTLYQSVDKENSAIGKLVVSEETDWTAESGKLPKHTEDGAEITYTLTEETVTGYSSEFAVQLPPQDDQAQDDQAHEAKEEEQKYTVTNTLEKYKLTIRYWKNAVGGEKVTGDYSAEYAYNAPYSVQSPDLYGWDADMSRVEGRMPNEDLVVDVVYRQLIFKLTIYYIFEDGTTAHKEYEAKLTAGEKFAVESPEIEGYKPNLWMISGEMPARDLNYTVIYMAQNTPVDLSAATAPLGIGNVVPNAGDCFD